MTKKSAARLKRDAFKKEQAHIQKETSTLWNDVKATSKLCWEMLSQNRLILTSLKSGITDFIPKDQVPILNKLLNSLSGDLERFKVKLEEVDARHANYSDTSAPIEDQEKVIGMFALAIECQNEYRQIIEQYETVALPDANRITEIIAMGEEALYEYIKNNEGGTLSVSTGEQYRITNGKLVLDDANTITDVEIIEKAPQ